MSLNLVRPCLKQRIIIPFSFNPHATPHSRYILADLLLSHGRQYSNIGRARRASHYLVDSKSTSCLPWWWVEFKYYLLLRNVGLEMKHKRTSRCTLVQQLVGETLGKSSFSCQIRSSIPNHPAIPGLKDPMSRIGPLLGKTFAIPRPLLSQKFDI